MGGNMASGQENSQQGGDWYNMENREDYEAYMKWCEENRARTAEFQQQQRLLEQFQQRQSAQREEQSQSQVKAEAEEKQRSSMAEWKMMEKQMEAVAEFDKFGQEIMEMKASYYYKLTFQFLKFCKCTDFTGELDLIFTGSSSEAKEFDLDSMEDNIEITDDPVQVAQALAQRPVGEQVLAMFGGLAEAMCAGAERYTEQIENWEKEHHFLERLSM